VVAGGVGVVMVVVVGGEAVWWWWNKHVDLDGGGSGW